MAVNDDGHGMAPESIPSSFENLGGSWKVKARTSPNIARPLNGKLGRGRLRGFALGNLISWATIAQDTAGVKRRTVISGHSSDPTNFQIDDSPAAPGSDSGTEFLGRMPPEANINRLGGDAAAPKITAAFALFLTANPGVVITFDGRAIDPQSAERHRVDYQMDEVPLEDGLRPPVLRVIEWKKDAGRALYLCDRDGNVIDRRTAEIRAPGHNFTAYVMWDGFADQADDIPLAEFYDEDQGGLLGAVREKLTQHFRAREDERREELIRQWKANGEYPYTGDPDGEAERAEREVFDYVATT